MGYGGKLFDVFFTSNARNTMNLTHFIQMYKSMCHIQGPTKISDILWAMLGNGWKHILNCIS